MDLAINEWNLALAIIIELDNTVTSIDVITSGEYWIFGGLSVNQSSLSKQFSKKTPKF